MSRTLDKNKKHITKTKLILLLFVAAVCIKRIFVDFDSDAGYAAALGYRLVLGDRMFTGMWEPHQTSAFVIAFFELIYVSLFHTTKGIVIYLNIIGCLLKSAVCIFLYNRLKMYFKKETSFISSCIFMILSPKLLIIPEYSNLQLYSSVMMFCFIVSFLRNEKKTDLICASLFLFLSVAAYPSCVLLWVPAVCILFKYSKKGLMNSLILTLICALAGGLYILYFVATRGAAPFFESLKNIMVSDPSHSMTLLDKTAAYLYDLIGLFLAFAVIFFISKAFVFVKERSGGKVQNPLSLTVLSCLVLTAIWALADTLVFYTDFCFNEFLTGLLVFAMYHSVKGPDSESRLFFRIAVCISVFQLISTCILSNLSLHSSIGYMTLGFCVSAAYLMDSVSFSEDSMRWSSLFACIILIPVIFINLFICRSISFCYIKLTDIRGVSKTGPSYGIFSEYMGPYILDNTYREFQSYVPEGATVLISGNYGMLDGASSMEYLDRRVNIGVKDTQTSCILDESQALYWEVNPDKLPDVVVTVCWFGEEKESEDSWLIRWINENYRDAGGEVHYIDGMYRRYYYSPDLWAKMQEKMH